MQTVSFDLFNLEKRLRAKEFRIPQFQRDFTWRESQVKLLVDSIARNYPIGSLLVLPESPNTPETLNRPHFYSRSIDAVISGIRDSDSTVETEVASSGIQPLDKQSSDFYYVLDGQQRLTSIARVFLNANPDKNYYFDLKRMLKSFEQSDQEGTNWIVSRQRGQSDPERKDKNRLLRTDIALDQQKTDIYVSEYIEDSDDFPEFKDSRGESRKAAARIKGIFETIRKYQVPIVILDRDAGVEFVCRVFETINSTGTRLTTFDLAVARFYPDPDLRKFWGETEDKHPNLKHFGVNGERVLQVLTLLNAKRNNSFFEPTRGSLLALRPDFVKENWSEASDKLAKAYQWVEIQNGARPDTLPNEGLLVPIATFMILYRQIVDDPHGNFLPVMQRWFYSNILQQGSKLSTNYKIGEDFKMLVSYAEQNASLTFPNVHLTIDSLVKINKGADNRFKALQCLMAMNAKDDLLSAKSLDGQVDDHHIFPRAIAKRGHNISLGELDSIANRIAVSTDTNSRLSDELPQEYFRKLQDTARSSGTAPIVNRRLRQCLIPGDISSDDFLSQFELPNFSNFLKARADLILEKVLEVVGDSLQIADLPEEDE